MSEKLKSFFNSRHALVLGMLMLLAGTTVVFANHYEDEGECGSGYTYFCNPDTLTTEAITRTTVTIGWTPDPTDVDDESSFILAVVEGEVLVGDFDGLVENNNDVVDTTTLETSEVAAGAVVGTVTGLTCDTTYTFGVRNANDESSENDYDEVEVVETSPCSSGGGGGSSNNAPFVTPPTTVGIPGILLGDIGSHWAQVYIQALVDLGIIKGYPDGTFKPDKGINRAEYVTIIVRTFAFANSPRAELKFKDVDKTQYYADPLAVAVAAGWIVGYEDGTFRPAAPINRAEAVKVLLYAIGASVNGSVAAPFPDVDQKAWYAKFVNYAAAHGIVNGYSEGPNKGKFGPANGITRAEVAKIVYMVLL